MSEGEGKNVWDRSGNPLAFLTASDFGSLPEQPTVDPVSRWRRLVSETEWAFCVTAPSNSRLFGPVTIGLRVEIVDEEKLDEAFDCLRESVLSTCLSVESDRLLARVRAMAFAFVEAEKALREQLRRAKSGAGDGGS